MTGNIVPMVWYCMYT